MTLTVGQASGLIALAVITIQMLLPLAIIFLLVCVVHDKHNAITWSVISRSLQSSWWPTIFRTDSASAHHVSRRVTFLSSLVTLSLLLLGIAGIITPLGLSDAIKQDATILPRFQYLLDESAFGYGTPERYSRFSRLCGQAYLLNCPGRFDGVTTLQEPNGTYLADIVRPDAYLNSSIPQNISEIFGSATSETTLTGPFDIQYRAWGLQFLALSKRLTVDRGMPLSKGLYRPLDSLILHNKVEVLEGVIVDTMNAGVGYRNHTIPANLSYGGVWLEDITWIEPITECADTNLTFEISVAQDATNISNVDLIDNGGFTNLPPQIPSVGEAQTSQKPDLAMRAYQGAYLSNSLLMTYLNITYPSNPGPRNTSLGRRFSLNTGVQPYYNPELYSIALTNLLPSFLQLFPDHPSIISNVSAAAEAKLSVSLEDWNTIQTLCGGNASVQQPNVSNVGIMCGYLYGAPDPITHKGSRIFQPYSKYKQNLYVCASGVRASVKQVRFSINGSATLDNLRVVSVEDKNYENNASRPLWAVERTYRPVTDAKPLWGMVDDRYEMAQDLSTLRADKLWLPATTTEFGFTEGNIDSLASTAVLFGAIVSTYKGSTKGSGIKTVGGPSPNLLDYSGSNNAALNRLWWTFSRSPSTANKIVNLIFTEVLATATVGTKSAIIPSNGSEANSLNKVVQYKRKLQYNLLYAIPAFVILFICLLTTAGVILCLITRFSLRKMSQLLNQTSTGRVITNLLYPDISKVDATTSQWLLAAGDMQIEYPFRGKSNLGQTVSSHEQDDTSEKGDSRSRDAEERTEAADEQVELQTLQPDGSGLPVEVDREGEHHSELGQKSCD